MTTSSALRVQIQAAAGGNFSLAAKDLGVPGVEAMLTAHFGGTLVVTGVVPNAARLSLSGTVTLDSLQNRPVELRFSCDAAGTNVTGMLVAVKSPDWTLKTSLLEFAGEYLKAYPFSSLALILSARPGDETDQAFGVGIGVYAMMGSEPLLLSAVLPASERNGNQTRDIALDGTFDGITLDKIALLADLAGGCDFGHVSTKIPLADQLELRSVRFVVDPELASVVVLGIEVRSAKPWGILPDKIAFDYVDVYFQINAPGTGTTVFWSVTAELEIADAVSVVVGIDSDLDLEAELDEPVPLKPVLSRFAPSLNLDLTVESFRFGADLSQTPVDWGFDLTIESGWTLLDGVALQALQLVITAQGLSVDDVQINATLKLGDAILYIAGHLNQGAGWDFAGRLAHDYNVRLQPNPSFDPDSPNPSLFQAVPLPNDTSHFFTAIFDKLFPGGAPSGISPLLDIDIKMLSATFNTASKDFTFDAEIDFGSDVDAVLSFSRLHQEGTAQTTFDKRATGTITLFPGKANTMAFALGLDLQQGSRHFVAAYSNTSGQSISLSDLVKALFPKAPAGIPAFSITLRDGIVGYVSDGKTSQSVFALDLGASIDLSSLGDIPLVGDTLSAAKSLKLAFQIVYPAIAAGATFAKADLAALNALITVAGPRFPADADLTGLFAKTELRLGDGAPIDFNLPLSLNVSGQLQRDANKPPFNPPASQATDDGVKWFQLNKSFGPLSLQRAGFKFDESSEEVTVVLDGGLAALGLVVDLMGLSVTTKVTGVSDFSPRFDLHGLGVSFAKGGVEIAGVLLHVGDEYSGLASLQAEEIGLAAIGSLTRVNGNPSLFIYAVLDDPLGGAPAFYVTGLAAGFGLNRKLVVPSVDQVATFPFVAEAMSPPVAPSDPGAAATFITTEMQKLDEYLIPSLGEYFGCAGIRFSSFELLDSFVLVNVSFGRHFELDLLGLSSLVIPPEAGTEPALAVIRLQIAGSFIPDEGVVLVQGQLTRDSYLLDPNCHLTGGFAVGGWFGASPQAGDFVVTLGGYNPGFSVPSYYPTVPRVGIDWQISSSLSVTGGYYFALTPRAIMAGGALRAVFAANVDADVASADIRAWFILGADFIVYWKPFSYRAEIYVDMGLEVAVHFFGTHHLSLDANADLTVWGPPFSGHAHVRLSVIGIHIGFDVDFGGDAPSPAPLDWLGDDAARSFRRSFLPADEQIASTAVAGGLVRKIDVSLQAQSIAAASATAGGDSTWYVVNPTELRLQTASVIPIKTCDTAVPWADGKHALAEFGSNAAFGIAPMAKAASQVDTLHQIAITRDGDAADTDFVLRPVNRSVPGGLWAEANSQNVNEPATIENAAVGFEIVPAKDPVGGATKSIDRALLRYSTDAVLTAWTPGAISAFTPSGSSPGDDPGANVALWNSIQSEIHENAARDSILAALGFRDTDIDIGERLSTDAAYAPLYGTLQTA